jgi:hypothetical protein
MWIVEGAPVRRYSCGVRGTGGGGELDTGREAVASGEWRVASRGIGGIRRFADCVRNCQFWRDLKVAHYI